MSKEPLKLTPIEDLKKALGVILKADKAEVDAEVRRPRRKRRPRTT